MGEHVKLGKMFVLLGAVGMAAACRPAEGTRQAGKAVDSIVSREEALGRFRHGIPAVSALQGGRQTREDLFKAVIGALGKQDTAALATLALTRPEFAYLYYPTTPQGLPPYDLDPSLLWHMLVQRSDRGIRRALNTYGGQQLRLVSQDCGPRATQEGDNLVWGPCVLRASGRGDTISLAISRIIERNGQYKVLSYGNKL